MPNKLDKIYSISSLTSDKLFAPLYVKDLRSHGVLTLENMFAFSIKKQKFHFQWFLSCVSIEWTDVIL